ncbi:hypothetical protein HZB93_01305 [Candidatus Falkowbacteria bacterium]|nr:hypothetical protein [Candidatus Falkowbacteria bacterium]
MQNLIKRKNVVGLIAVFVLTCLLTIYNQSNASALSAVSDTMSRQKVGVSANHEITFTLAASTTVTASETITVIFTSGFASGLNGIDCSDVDLLDDGVQENFNNEAGGCTPTATEWGAAVSARTLTLAAPSGAGTYIDGSSVVILRIGTNAAEEGSGDEQIVNPASSGSHLIYLGGTFGDSSTIAVAILTEDQVNVEGSIASPPGGGTPGGDTTPPIISNLRVVNILQTSATVFWDTNEPATSRVNYGLSNSYGLSTIGDGGLLVTSHRVDLTGLAADTIYHFDVVTADASGHTTTTADDIFRTLSGADVTPPTISNIRAVNITENSADILWDTNEPATSKVEYGLTTSYELGAVTLTDLVTSHSVPMLGLLPNTIYHFRVSSADSSGNEAASIDNTFTTAIAVPPPVISNIQVIDITLDSGTVTWQTDRAATSRVRYGLTTSYELGDISSVALVTAHSIPLTSLLPNTVYHFEVSSADASGRTATSTDQNFTTLPDITPPTNVSDFLATVTPEKQIMLTWVNPTDPDFAGVLIRRSFTGYPADPTDGDLVFNGLADSFLDTNITPADYNRPIYYTAFAYDTSGNYAGGAIAQATIEVEITLDVKAWPEKRWPRTDHWQTRAVVDLREVGASSTVLADGTVTTSSLGEGSVVFTDAAPQSYDVGFKGLSHLRKILRNVSLTAGYVTLDFTDDGEFYLKAGDVHRSRDNLVNALDLSTLLAVLSGANEVSDLNQDTRVNSLDINILLANLIFPS